MSVAGLIAGADAVTPLYVITPEDWAGWTPGKVWLEASGFTAEDGAAALWPGADGAPAGALVVAEADAPLWSFGGLSGALPPGAYALAHDLPAARAEALALGWAFGAWRFGDEAGKRDPARLVYPARVERRRVDAIAEGVTLARDLITAPANALGPEALAARARAVAEAQGARYTEIVGDDLLRAHFPLIHSVGRAAEQVPRLIEFRWGPAEGYAVTLVGKGVCFDSGGLDLKPAAAMKLMKKDMGGAGNVLALAHMIMALDLPVALRVLIPAVENAVSSRAFRPGDVITARNGLTVEIGNTDAEGRLVLADALSYALEDGSPDLLIDMATLTGAARVALGTDLPALFCSDDQLAQDLLDAGQAVADPLWRMPLYKPYANMLESKIADLNNAPDGPYGGAITAALFLKRFIDAVATPPAWAHIDLMAWTLSAKPGRPEGGEAMGPRALLAAIAARCRR